MAWLKWLYCFDRWTWYGLPLIWIPWILTNSWYSSAKLGLIKNWYVPSLLSNTSTGAPSSLASIIFPPLVYNFPSSFCVTSWNLVSLLTKQLIGLVWLAPPEHNLVESSPQALPMVFTTIKVVGSSVKSSDCCISYAYAADLLSRLPLLDQYLTMLVILISFSSSAISLFRLRIIYLNLSVIKLN